ncbi:MAG: pantetheine-phosphate adenylyltransferase [Clostridia bacterium]|nr:pantetheine-phosphate adenylyltransferase [Clostridia bacterium]
MKAMFPGSFHPPTLGHMDIIRRAAGMFEKLYVAILINQEKQYLISADARKEMFEKCLGDLDNVEVVTGTGLTVDLARQLGCAFLVRGVRDASDYAYELKLADINRTLSGVDTLFLPARPEISSVASSIVMDIARHGGDISPFVPTEIKDDILSAIK